MVPSVAVAVFLPLFCFVLHLREAVVVSSVPPELIVFIFLCALFKHICALPLLRPDLVEQKHSVVHCRGGLPAENKTSLGYDWQCTWEILKSWTMSGPVHWW